MLSACAGYRDHAATRPVAATNTGGAFALELPARPRLGRAVALEALALIGYAPGAGLLVDGRVGAGYKLGHDTLSLTPLLGLGGDRLGTLDDNASALGLEFALYFYVAARLHDGLPHAPRRRRPPDCSVPRRAGRCGGDQESAAAVATTNLTSENLSGCLPLMSL